MNSSSGEAPTQDTAVADLEPADEVETFGEDLSGFERSVGVVVGEDDEAVEPFTSGAATPRKRA